ncbi:MAG: DUF4139 domain-containing protein, partial [Myxococcales bacterium]
TAIPAMVARVPEPPAWKIGERERFVPRPAPAPLTVRPAPAQPPPLPRLTDEGEELRRQLLARAAQAPEQPQPQRKAAPELNAKRPGAPPPPPSRPRVDAPAPAQRSAPGAYDFDDAELEGRRVQPQAESLTISSGRSAAYVPTTAYSLSPPPTWRRPTYAAELPAMAAGGYDLAYAALQPETVESGKGSVRVGLFTQRWDVKVERKLFPALAPEAFLVAELKNPSDAPLPGGTAQLFVGDDPAGQARLELVSPQETFTLPLGLDRAIKHARNVELVTSEEGLIGKDEVTRYRTTIEIANPWPTPVAIKVFDQHPVPTDGDTRIELLETKPWAIQDKATGKLEWHLTLPPNGRTTVEFTYSLRRPKNWRLYQRQ